MERFKKIFEGLHRAYGTFKEEDEDEKGKKKEKPLSLRPPLQTTYGRVTFLVNQVWELFLYVMILPVVGVALMLTLTRWISNKLSNK